MRKLQSRAGTAIMAVAENTFHAFAELDAAKKRTC